ncbi:MAG TPA: hypothetical protein VGK73_32425 [Polyangiaceae bacterium]
MPPQKQSALGALKARPSTPKPVPTPQDIWDVDALLADTKDFAEGLPSDPMATAMADADLEASMERQRTAPPDPNAWKSKVGVVGAMADSLATPIRVVSGFGGPVPGFIGEGVAQGLESIANLDGKPLMPGQGENVFRDTVSGFGRAGTAALFGKVGGAVPALIKRSGLKSLAARIGLGVTAGAAEGAASNVAQGAMYRGFADGTNAAFNSKAMALDAKLGAGIGGATGGALTALQARARRGLNNAGTTRFEGPMPENARVDAEGRTVVGEDPYWQQEATEGFQATPWSADDVQRFEGTRRTPVQRQRFNRMMGTPMPPPGTYPEAPAGRFPESPAGQFPEAPLGRFPASPAGQFPEDPPGRFPEAPGGRFPEDPLGRYPEVPPGQFPQPPEDFVPPSPPPTGPQPPGPGRLPGGGGVAFDPFVPPEGTGAPDLTARDDFWAAMDETSGANLTDAEVPPAVVPEPPPQGPMVRQPFEGRVPPDVAKAMRNDAFGVPTLVRFDGKTVHITYNNGGKIQTQQLPAAALDAIPELDAMIPRAPGEPPAPALPDGPSFRDDPAQMDALEALMAERAALEAPQVPVARADAAVNERFATPQEDMQPAPAPEAPVARPTEGRIPERGATEDARFGAAIEKLSREHGADWMTEFKRLMDTGEIDAYVSLAEIEARKAARRRMAPPVAERPPVVTEEVPTQIAAGDDAGMTDDEIARLLQQADEQDAAAVPEAVPEPEVEFVDPDTETTLNNASGDSSASIEAIRRMKEMAGRGESFVMLDRAGNERPLIGTDAVDQAAPKGFTKAKKLADGSYQILDDNGGRVPPRAATPSARESAPPPAAPDEPATFDLTEDGSSELDRIVLEGMDGPPPAQLFGADLPGRGPEPPAAPTPVPVRPTPPTPGAPGGATAVPDASIPPAKPEVEPTRVNGAEPEIPLADGDTPGTINQAGKFTAIDPENWQAHEPGKNKNLVVRKADGTYQIVKNNGGKTPKTWSKELAAVRESEAAARKEREAQRQAALAAKRAEKEQAAAAKAKARADAGEPPEPVVAAPDEADSLVTPAEGGFTIRGEDGEPMAPPRVEFDAEHGAWDIYFERKPDAAMRAKIGKGGYGARWIDWKQKWSFKIPEGSKLTPESVKADIDAIMRGEDPDSPQRGINADSLNRKATDAARAEGRWAPEPGKNEIADRDLSPDAAERDARRKVLIGLGWKQTKNAANRRVWNAPGVGMAGDKGRGASEVAPTPTNPPQAEAPSVPSAPDATSSPRTSGSSDSLKSRTPTPDSPNSPDDVASAPTPDARATSEPDAIQVRADEIKVDADAYQFKTGGDEKGRLEKLKGVEEWDSLAGKLTRVLLHRRTDGSLYVVDGHQRVGLAQDLLRRGKDVPPLNAIVLDEAAGVTVDDARRAGALFNVLGGTTEPMDIARVLRSGDLTPAEQRRVGKIQADSGERFRQGRDLAALEPAAFTYLLQTGDAIEPRFARLVSQYKGEELQVALLRALERNDPQNVSAAKSILAKASDLQATVKQPGIFEDMPTVADVDFEELVKFEQKVLGVFKKNKRVFGKGLDNAAFLENAGETKIDRDAMAAISSEADRSQFLFDKYANANGSETKRTLKEVFDEHQAGRLSLGAAADRVAKALEADFTGRPTSGGEGARPVGDGPGEDAGPGLWDDEPETTGRGSITDAGAVARGADGALEDDADDVLDFLKRAGKKLMDDERGAVPIGDGIAGLEDAYKRNPTAVWTALRTVGGGFLGGATHDEDDPDDASILDNIIIGAVAGFQSKRAPGIARALAKKAPTLARDIREVIETGRLLARGEYKAMPQVRKQPDLTKDISGFAQKFWTPDKVVPDVWKHIEPIMADIYKSDADAKLTPAQRLVARKMRVEEAVGYMKQAYKGSKDAGHYRRAAYIKALRDELLNKPTFLEKQISDLTNGKVTPKRVRQANAIVTNAIYHNLLGWAVDSGLANMTQALMNIPRIGVKSTVKGIITAYSKKGRQEFDFLDLNRRPMGQDEERLFHPWLEKYLDWSQEPMRFSDSANRRATYAGALDYAKKHKMSPEQAKAFASELVGQTQGIAGDLGNNPFHRHLGPLRVFTKFPMVWASMLQDIATHPDPAVKLRALGMMTGIYAFSAISGVEAMNFFWPRMGGLPGPSAAVDVMSHAFGAPDHEFEEHFEWGGTEDRLAPRFVNKAGAVYDRFAEYGDEERPIVGRKGQVLREISAEEDLLSLLGIETTERSETRQQESDMYQTAADTRLEESIRSRRARREAGLAIGMRDEGRASRALEALSDRQRKAFLKDREMSTRERARRLTPLRRRDEFDETFEEDQP